MLKHRAFAILFTLLVFCACATSDDIRLKCRMVDLPRLETKDLCEPVVVEVSFPRCDYPRHSRALNRFVESKSRAEGGLDDYAASGSEDGHDCEPSSLPIHIGSSCQPPFRVANVLSFACRKGWEGVRSDSAPWSLNVDISGPALRVLELNDFFPTPERAAAFWALVKKDLEEQVDSSSDFGFSKDAMRERLSELSHQSYSINLTDHGVTIGFTRWFMGFEIIESIIPYEDLHGILETKLIPAASHPE